MANEQQIGDYLVLEQLDKGPLGETVLAEHKLLKRQYTIKILGNATEQQRSRFEDRLQALAHFKHPYLMPIHTASILEDRLCIISECEIGNWQTLEAFLRQRSQTLREEEAETILRQIAAAIDYLHEQSPAQCHGGLRPSSVLVNLQSGVHVRLLDVGWSGISGEVAAVCYEEQDPSRFLALSRHFRSIYPFLSPEQRSGDLATAKSDIFSFGVLVYYLLTRSYPEGYFDPIAHSANGVSLPWDRLLATCLRPDPKQRHLGLLNQLDELRNGSAGVVPSDPLGICVGVMSAVKPITVDRAVSNYAPPKSGVGSPSEPLHTQMVKIEGGEYLRGADCSHRDEGPRHRVHLSAFWLDIHPVTNEQFKRFLDSRGSEKDEHNNDLIRLREARIKRSGGRLTIEPGYARHPVVGVSWYGAKAYADWIGKRLPTEAEWEIACRAGVETSFAAGENIDKNQANFFSSDTTPVMSYPPNSWGLFDLSGNVYEWCADWYSYNFYDFCQQEPDDPKGPSQGIYRVLRGGCWRSVKEDLRCAHRHRNNPGAVNSTYGFRCASSSAPVVAPSNDHA